MGLHLLLLLVTAITPAAAARGGQNGCIRSGDESRPSGLSENVDVLALEGLGPNPDGPTTPPRRAVVQQGHDGGWLVIACHDDGGYTDGDRCAGMLDAAPVSSPDTLEHTHWTVSAEPKADAFVCSPTTLIAWPADALPTVEEATPAQPAKPGRHKAAIARALGTRKVQLSQLHDVDLDGDGESEVVFSARWTVRGADGTPEAQAAVGVRRGDQIVIVGQGRDVVSTQEPRWRLEGFADLEDDGRFELVVRERGDHSLAVGVWAWSNGQVRRLGGNGCAW